MARQIGEGKRGPDGLECDRAALQGGPRHFERVAMRPENKQSIADADDNAALTDARRVLWSTLGSLGDGVLAIDLDGYVTYLNPPAETLLGWTWVEAAGEPADEVFKLRDHVHSRGGGASGPQWSGGMFTATASDAVVVAREGREFPIRHSTAPILDENGNMTGRVFVFRELQSGVDQGVVDDELADFFENASVGLHWVAADGTILRANRAELELLGYEYAEYVGNNISNFHVDAAAADDILRRLLRGETLNKYPARMRCKNGTVRDVLINSNSLWRDGEFVHTRCITIDMTDRRESEESRALLAALVNASDDAIISKSPDGRILSWNRGAERLFGFMESEAVGQPIELIVPEDARGENNAVLRRLKRGERAAPFETVRLAKDGLRIDVSVTMSLIRDDSNRIVATSEVARDITDRKRAEQALHASEERYRALIESQGEMLCRFKPDGTILFVNEAYARSRGTTPDALLDANFWEFIPEEDHADVKAMLERLSPETPEVRIENRFEAIDGPRWTLWTNRGLKFAPNGALLEAQSTGIDITRRKQMEQALKESDRRKDEFLATLAHELRNPLAPIGNSLEILKKAGDDPEVSSQAHQAIERQWTHLVRLVDDLLDVSRITRDRLELRKSRVDLVALVHQAVDTCRPMSDEQEQAVTVTAPGDPLYLEADPVRLAQVLNNLLNNACKFTQHGGRIHVEVATAAGEALVSIADNGIGLPQDQLERVFEMFSQVHNHFDRSPGGLGIGLTLVKRLVALHGGSITASSKGPGKGSKFVVRLPLPATEPREQPASGREPLTTIARRVLVVDDNTDSAESLSMLLKLHGHETLVAYDGLEAIEAAEQFRPDIVLLDLGLPKLNGIEACRRIRATPWGQELRIVALTGWGQDEDRRRSTEAGFDHHLVKPVDHDSLMRLLSSAGSKIPER